MSVQVCVTPMMAAAEQTATYVLDGERFLTRVISPGEVKDAFYNLLDKEGWNIKYSKIEALGVEFPDAIFVTIQENTGELVAMITSIESHPGQFIIGNFVVRMDMRRKGHGRRMIDFVKEVRQDATLTLTAVPGAYGFYRKFGFHDVEPTHYVYFIDVNRDKVNHAVSLRRDSIDADDVAIATYSLDLKHALNEYDTEARGYDCGRYLSVMTRSSDIFLVARSKVDGRIVGYASGVDEGDLLWVDGMYADSDDIALLLFRHILDAYPSKHEMRIQTIKPREYLVQFGQVLPKSRTYTRMATRHPTSPVLSSKLYAVADCDEAE